MPFLVYNPDHEIAQITADIELCTSVAFNYDRYRTLSSMLQDWIDNVTEADLLRLRSALDHCHHLLARGVDAQLKRLLEGLHV